MLDFGPNGHAVAKPGEMIDGPLRSVGLDGDGRAGFVDRIDHPARPGLGVCRLDAGLEAPHRYLQQ